MTKDDYNGDRFMLVSEAVVAPKKAYLLSRSTMSMSGRKSTIFLHSALIPYPNNIVSSRLQPLRRLQLDERTKIYGPGSSTKTVISRFEKGYLVQLLPGIISEIEHTACSKGSASPRHPRSSTIYLRSFTARPKASAYLEMKTIRPEFDSAI